MPDSSANNLISSFLNFPITVKECKKWFFATNFFLSYISLSVFLPF